MIETILFIVLCASLFAGTGIIYLFGSLAEAEEYYKSNNED